MSEYKDILIAAGGNQPLDGQSSVDVMSALDNALLAEGLETKAKSPLFLTPCFPAGAGPDFVNMAFRLHDCERRSPAEVLAALHRIEARFGRQRLERWGVRTLDLDLLAVGDNVLPNAAEWRRWHDLAPTQQMVEAPNQLILPHPRIQDRAFVLVPLSHVAPDWVHPVLCQSVSAMLAALPEADRAAVRLLEGGDSALVNTGRKP